MFRDSSHGFFRLMPIYPLLVQQFVDDYGLDTGIAVDVGTGPGWLGMELAKITHMEITFFDVSEAALEESKQNVAAAQVDNIVSFLQGDVHHMPIRDNFADFVMSRGSLCFWENPSQGLREVERIIKPGGVAIVGGGLGRYVPETMRQRINRSIRDGFRTGARKRPTQAEFAQIVKMAELSDYRIISDGDDWGESWVEIRK